MFTTLPILLCLMTGCVTAPWKKIEDKLDAPKENITLTSGGLERLPIDSKDRQDLEAAKRLFDDKKYAQAEPLFHQLVKQHSAPEWWEIGPLAPSEPEAPPETSEEGKKNKGKAKKSKRADVVCETALFYEAECQRMQKNYREAVDTYTKLLVDFPRTQFTSNACKGLFEIADYWLEPTRRQMDEYQEQIKGKRYFVTPALYWHWDHDMPFLDAEGHATATLNIIRLHDIKGEMGKEAVFYLGTITFFRQDYNEADFYFTQIYKEYPNSELAAKAIKQSVICKQLMTGGSIYDCRGVEESKKLLMQAQASYPELARDEKWVETQLKSINIQQADRDFKVAEFYQRTGHPGSAYFYYELVCRRYPGTAYATKASQRKTELKTSAEKEHKKQTPGEPSSPPGTPNPTIEGVVPPPAAAPPRVLPPALDAGNR